MSAAAEDGIAKAFAFMEGLETERRSLDFTDQPAIVASSRSVCHFWS